MAAQGVAFVLEGAKLQLATVTVPLAALPAQSSAQQAGQGSSQPDLLPPPLPPAFAALAAALAAVRAAATSALPFAAHVLGADQLRVVCQKTRVADVFKLLRGQQAALGITVKDVKSHVSLAAPAGQELAAACTAGLAAVLRHAGWWQMDEECLLGASPLEPSPDGRPTTCAAVRMRVHVAAPAGPKEAPKLLLLVLPELVEFQHPACRPGLSLDERNARLAGTLCTLLPDLRPALVRSVRAADAATLALLRPLWGAHGQPLPAEVAGFVEVCLDCDPDAPSFPVPTCRVLGQYGLQSVAAKRSAPGVQAALAKLRDDLAGSSFKFLGEGVRLGGTAHEWYPDGPPPLTGRQLAAAAAAAEAAPAVVFMTARQHEEQAQKQQADEGGPALGPAIDVASFSAAAEAGAGATQQRQRKRYAPIDPKLQAAFDEAKLLLAETERPPGTAAAARPVADTAAAASTSKPQPLALRQAAAAAAGGTSQRPGLPTFKKVGAAATAGAAPKKAAAGQKAAAGAKPAAGQKRAAAGAKPPAPKRPKAAAAAAATASAASTPRVPAALGFSAENGDVPASVGAAAASAAPPSAAKPAMGRPQLASTAAHGSGVGAAGTAGAGTAAAPGVPPKAPAKPRAKAADIDIATVTAKVLGMHAAGTLGKVTIPELKAYLKSIKQPVGGKKGELEERVRQSLGGAAAAARVAASTPAPAPAAGVADTAGALG